ncbi:hypothetical protein [Streptomyces sp. CNQ085]|uniref:hypothetical protein n=1 Tax=Streptomyces sp. CNQ085 TaxID=2886944 RepID=UPI001F5064A3|nr:hypothetical protein [Streptomyces sp. CNQ085]MCI0384584.1 hypothetical protein [Streptomyces sp. CNQ085]
MALDPLATVADLEARGLTVEESELTVTGTYLDVASAIVREAAGCPISQTTSTVEVEGDLGPWLSLPGPPVTDVSAVAIEEEAVTDWRLRSGRLWRAAGWAQDCDPSEVTVTYTHGLPTVPPDIVDLVCRLAAASLIGYRGSDSTGENLGARVPMQERIGDWSATYSYVEKVAETELPRQAREQLRARFGGGTGTVRFR